METLTPLVALSIMTDQSLAHLYRKDRSGGSVMLLASGPLVVPLKSF